MEDKQKLMPGVIAAVWVIVCLGFITGFAAQLPPEILVDKYLLQATILSEEKDHKGALEAMNKIVALQKKHDLTLPEAFSFQYAQTALAAGLVQAAIALANRYLSTAGRQGKHYREALELLVKAERKRQEPAVDRVGSTPVKPVLEPQPQAMPPSSTQTQKTIEVQPAPDCRGWNTKRYFRTASVESVTACLAAGADPMARNKDKSTPLHYAASYSRDPAVIEALLKAGADPKARSKYKSTPLHWAAVYSKDPAVIEALLKAGADPMARNKYKSTPLHLAATLNENPAVIEALLTAGANLSALDKDGRTPLYLANKYNENPSVRQALLAAGAGRVERQIAAAQTQRKSRSGGGSGLAALVAGVTGGAIAAAGGLDAATATEIGATIGGSVLAGEAVGSSGTSATSGGTSGNTGATGGGGPCQVPGYPKPPGGVSNLGFPWCPASVGMQVRAFALQAAGAQCAIATGSSSTPEQIKARRQEIRAACDRLAAVGARLAAPGGAELSVPAGPRAMRRKPSRRPIRKSIFYSAARAPRSV